MPPLRLSGWVLVGACVAIALSCPVANAAQSELSPFKLVRSYFRLQDQIAAGDGAALGMQKQLYKTILEALGRREPAGGMSENDLRSILTFALAGGGPGVARGHIARFAESTALHDLAAAVLRFRHGEATSSLDSFDPHVIGGMLGATVALARGHARADPALAIADLEQARLLAPGSMIEEVALRRLLRLYREHHDESAFVRTAARYARGFARSPFARQFADDLVDGAVALRRPDQHRDLLTAIAFFPAPQRVALLDAIARAATMAGNRALFFAVSDRRGIAAPTEQATAALVSGPASAGLLVLYNRIPAMTREELGAARQQLDELDPLTLAPVDRNLRQAGLDVIAAITGPAVLSGVAPLEPDAVPIVNAAHGPDASVPEPDPETSGPHAAYVEALRARLARAEHTLKEID
jgi:chemotaxis protein MotC